MSRLLSLPAAMSLAVLSSGCYLNTPVDTTSGAPAVGESVALDITDRGRVALSERFGGSVAQIEGRLTEVTPTTWGLQVYKVAYLRQDEARWSGEKVQIDRDVVGQVYLRTLSRRRTVVASTIAVGTLAVLIVTRELVIRGRERDPSGGGDPNPESTRFPSMGLIH